MKIYRYQPINKYTVTSLTKQKNWVSDPTDFNDPFEFRTTEIYYYDSNGKIKYLNPEEKKFSIIFKETLEKFGVVCYTTVEPNHIMWSHYADKHKGICLEFDVKESNLTGIHRVNYLERFPKFEFSLESEKFREELIKICTSKSLDWAYENEYRQIVNSKQCYSKYPGKLSKIIFGCKSTLSDIELVLNVINFKTSDIKIEKNFINQNTYLMGKADLKKDENGSFKIPSYWDGLFVL